MTEFVGQREAFLKGHSVGYSEALDDIQKELECVRELLVDVKLPIIEGLLHKLENKKGNKNA